MQRFFHKSKRVLQLFGIQALAHQIWWSHISATALILAILCERWEYVGTALYLQLVPPLIVAAALTVLLSFVTDREQSAICAHHWNLAVKESPAGKLLCWLFAKGFPE